MNLAIRSAVEHYNDPKIRYIDINPALEGHRFCEKGHSFRSQINPDSSEVHIFNSPIRWFITIHDGDSVTTYEPSDDLDAPGPPEDILEKLRGYPEGESVQQDEYTITTFRNPEEPNLSMEVKVEPQPLNGGSGSGNINGKIARTLHPKQDGHKEIGDVIVGALKKNYRPDESAPEPPQPETTVPGFNCPSGCTCNSGVPLCF